MQFTSFPTSVQFSHIVMSDSLWPHESQHASSPCPSPSPGVHSDSCPSSQWCHPIISSSVVPFSFPSTRVFSNESVLRISWPEYWRVSFSISPSNEYSGLISFRMDWLDLLAVQGTLKSLLWLCLQAFIKAWEIWESKLLFVSWMTSNIQFCVRSSKLMQYLVRTINKTGSVSLVL